MTQTYESHSADGVKIVVVTDLEAHKQAEEQRRRQERAREDREYQKYGRAVAARLRALGRGHRYRLRKYRRLNSELGWFLVQSDVRCWLRIWHVKPSWVLGLTNTTQLRDGKVRETATIISCGDGERSWQVAVPSRWPRQGIPIPRILERAR